VNHFRLRLWPAASSKATLEIFAEFAGFWPFSLAFYRFYPRETPVLAADLAGRLEVGMRNFSSVARKQSGVKSVHFLKSEQRFRLYRLAGKSTQKLRRAVPWCRSVRRLLKGLDCCGRREEAYYFSRVSGASHDEPGTPPKSTNDNRGTRLRQYRAEQWRHRAECVGRRTLLSLL